MEALSCDGNLLSHPHTLRWFKEEAYYPSKIVDRMTGESSQKQSARTAFARAHDFVEKTLQKHQPPPLDSAVQRELDEIANDRLQEFGVRVSDISILKVAR